MRGIKLLYGFLILVVFFAFFCGIYLYFNDFNKETIPVIFPVIGAICLSLYFGYKSVYIDAPQIKSGQMQIALVQDKKSGYTFSLYPENSALRKAMKDTGNFEGLKEIDRVGRSTQYEQLNAFLKSNSGKLNLLGMVNFLDLAISEWFRKEENRIGTREQEVDLISHKDKKYFHVSNLVEASLTMNDEWNNIYKEWGEKKIHIPKGSKITRTLGENGFFELKLETKHSIFRIFSSNATSPKMNLNDDSVLMKRILHYNPALRERSGKLDLWVFVINVTFEQKSFSRFSDQAKIEDKWFDNIWSEFQKNFSWTQLQEMYIISKL
ncbi:MAG: hypothetical protein ACRBCK_11645 [Alphaproteobacteria bacterium]